MHRHLPVKTIIAVGLTFACLGAFGHPLGNFSMNQYTLIDLRGEVPLLHWQVDIAETPSFREMDLLDQDMDEEMSKDEIAAYLDKRVTLWFENLELSQNGEFVTMTLLSRRLRVLEGSETMPVFQIELTLQPTEWVWAADGEELLLEYRSANLINARGYREAKILMDNRFKVGLGPWAEGEYKYQQVVAIDEQENPIFQSFYNVYRMELGTPAGEAKEISLESDFEWSATAQSEDRPTVVIASHEDRYTPGEITFTPTVQEVVEAPAEPFLGTTAEPGPKPLSGPLSVARPTKTNEDVASESTEEPKRSMNVSTVALMVLVAVALIAVIRIVSGKRDGS